MVFRTLIYIFTAAILLLAGTILRIGPHIDFSHVAEGNLSAYYFDKFNRVATRNGLLAEDIWEFAPDKNPENVPPGLPYLGALVFKLLRFVAPQITPFGFAAWLPVFIYLIFGLTVFILFWRVERAPLAAILMLAVVSLAPIFASYTEYAYFVQESLGTVFLFLTVYFIANCLRSRFDVIAAILSLTAFILTWQQFPLFIFVALGLILAAVFLRKIPEAKALAFILVTGILSAEFISRVIIGIHYSALGMIKEIILGSIMLHSGNSDFLTAMTNIDWRHSTPAKFYQWYGPLTVFLVGWGLIISFLRKNDFRFLTSLIFGIAALALLWQFQKERIFVFGMLLFTIGVGLLESERKIGI
jgi:hypothetical protein